MEKHIHRNKTTRWILGVVLIVQVFHYLLQNPYFLGQNAISDWLYSAALAVNNLFTTVAFAPDGQVVFTLGNKLWLLWQKLPERVLWALPRIAPVCLMLNIVEAVLLKKSKLYRQFRLIMEAFFLKLCHLSCYLKPEPVSGLVPKARRKAIEAFKNHSKGHPIDVNRPAVRVRSYGEYPVDVVLAPNDQEWTTIMDARGNPLTVILRGDAFYTGTEEEEIPVGEGVVSTYINSANVEVIADIIEQIN